MRASGGNADTSARWSSCSFAISEDAMAELSIIFVLVMIWGVSCALFPRSQDDEPGTGGDAVTGIGPGAGAGAGTGTGGY
jgi:hypothetical protein